VAPGNSTRDAGIAHLRYRPRGASARPQVALVGKGICFDTGGTNLKTARGMQHMHEDMLGSAVALGTLVALTRLRVPFAVDCWLAITENRLSPSAYKPQDVVTASNGTTIEVIHTDAEGRMALADTLALASGEKPGIVIDYATLTGACVNAVTERYSGAFTNRDALEPVLVRAGRTSGERVWPFPLDSDFDEPLESQIADIKQCVIENEGDHILAARFLSRFVSGDTPWVHIDLASARKKGGLAHVPTDVTGFGVRYSLALLLDERLAQDGHAHR
jgi:leucyl aminopeptidase